MAGSGNNKGGRRTPKKRGTAAKREGGATAGQKKRTSATAKAGGTPSSGTRSNDAAPNRNGEMAASVHLPAGGPGSRRYLEALLSELWALPREAEVRPSEPVPSFLQEAVNLHNWALSDKDALIRADLAWSLVEALPVRSGALSQAEARWRVRRYTREQAQAAWTAARDRAYELRDDLLAAMRHAFRKTPELLPRVAAITEGGGHPDMIQDLNDIAVFGLDHVERLRAVGVSRENLNAAGALSDELAVLLAASQTDTTDDEAVKLRNRAFSYLKDAVLEIRKCGQYAFRKDPDRFRRYTSSYNRRHRRASGTEEEPEAPLQQPEGPERGSDGSRDETGET